MTLEDGTILKNNLSSHAGLCDVLDEVGAGLHLKEDRLNGRHATYFYGHSAGGFSIG